MPDIGGLPWRNTFIRWMPNATDSFISHHCRRNRSCGMPIKDQTAQRRFLATLQRGARAAHSRADVSPGREGRVIDPLPRLSSGRWSHQACVADGVDANWTIRCLYHPFQCTRRFRSLTREAARLVFIGAIEPMLAIVDPGSQNGPRDKRSWSDTAAR